MIHCSGGAQTKVLNFVENVAVVKDNLFPTPPLFRVIQQESGTPWSEMYNVFNMGHRLEFYVPQEIAQSIIDIAAKYNVEGRIIGRVEPSESTKVVICGEHGCFTYTKK
jgi:phosphoribosylformylglycinamidine cyclo-ligase